MNMKAGMARLVAAWKATRWTVREFPFKWRCAYAMYKHYPDIDVVLHTATEVVVERKRT